VIGLGGHLHLLREPVIVHTTDGAPRGTSGRSEYAITRRREVECAVGIAGVPADRLRTLGMVDQESVYALATMTRQICEMIAELRPHAIVTHPYEGGHPDHDAASFVVSAAVKASEQWKPLVIEFASYHNGNPGGPASMKSGEFLPGSSQVETIVLGSDDRARKQRMLECFASQQEMLAQFQVDTERFRYAPAYAEMGCGRRMASPCCTGAAEPHKKGLVMDFHHETKDFKENTV
jgi:N-acetylglucosamine malate deacetylase 2